MYDLPRCGQSFQKPGSPYAQESPFIIVDAGQPSGAQHRGRVDPETWTGVTHPQEALESC